MTSTRADATTGDARTGAPNDSIRRVRRQARGEIIAGSAGMRIVSINALSHLDRPGRRELITAT